MAALPVLLCHLPLIPHCRRVPPLALRPRALHCSASPRAPPFPPSPQSFTRHNYGPRYGIKIFTSLTMIPCSLRYRGRARVCDLWHIKARGSSYVNATLQLDRVEILSDVVLLIEDLAKGAVTFDTESEITGKLGVVVFDLPLK
ncbi:UNVERIFIED_CONTAM: hypothetical protein Sangu_2079200 [Sesamum angustifolium]|uniref:Uncharacterized protein n=1 Tax=Sesamum angustifolium TaxID=2727405 RepID=A0AAW2LJ00_9LAMI